VVNAYVELRDRMISFLRSLPEESADIVVPHCPDWTVQETVSHMVGVPEAILSGDLDGIASDAWTQRQVENHRGDSLKDLADAWEKNSEQFLTVLPMIPKAAMTQLVFDVASHEHDVRHAVGQPGARDSLSVNVGVRFMKHAGESRGDLDVEKIDQWKASEFDVFRSVAGRRSAEQIAAEGIDVEFVQKLLRPMPISIPAVSIAE
jgi:uncharacterized protein (TIGR03083 family)